MIRGLPASLMLHAAVIGAGYLAWPYVGTSVSEQEFVIVPVELVDVGEITNVAPVVEPPEEPPEPEPEEEPEPVLPEEEESEDPVEEEPDPRDVPEDDVSTAAEAAPPEPEEEDVVPDLEQEPEEEEAEPEPQPEPEKPKPDLPKPPNPKKESSALDSFLDDADSTFQSERQTKRASQPPPQERLLDETPPAQEARKGAGDRSANTVRIEQLLYNQVYPCWDGVADQPSPDRLNVSLRVELDADGNVSDVELLRPTRAPIGDRSMSLAIERGLRAVRKCQPYRLPRDDYELWKVANINLGPGFEGR